MEKFAVFLLSKLNINFVRIFGGFVIAERKIFAVNSTLRSPFPCIFSNAYTFISRLIAGDKRSIFVVLRPCGFSQIQNAIIVLYTISVVKAVSRVFAVHIKPSQAMHKVGTVSYPNNKIAIFICIPRKFFSVLLYEFKKSAFWIVRQILKQCRLCKIGGSHGAVPSLIG